MADTQTTLAANSIAAERLLYAPPDWVVIGSATNGTTTATAAAVAKKQNVLTKAVVSFSGQPATALTFTIKDGTTVIFQAEIPAATTSALTFDFSSRPLVGSINSAITGNLAAAGSGIVGTISLTGLIVSSA